MTSRQDRLTWSFMSPLATDHRGTWLFSPIVLLVLSIGLTGHSL